MKTLKKIINNEKEGTIKAIVLQDSDGDVSYIRDVAQRGCFNGACPALACTEDFHKFYTEHADEIDGILFELEESLGEPYNITENMKRLNITDLRTFLVGLAYEVRAQEIMEELEEHEKYRTPKQ